MSGQKTNTSTLKLCTACHYLTTYIIRLALNTEVNTVCLSGWHAQMTQFEVCPLVCPYSAWPWQGFYVDLLLIDGFPSE